jgi:hypothetical protein
MKRMISALAVVAIASSMFTATAVTKTAAATIAPRTFTGTGSLGRYYTVQTVNGTFATRRPVPTDVTVLNWQNVVLASSSAPLFRRHYDGGYWKRTYHLDAWFVGRTSNAAFYLLLPDSGVGATFTGMLKTEFLPHNGNWQNWMDFTTSNSAS